MEIKIKRKVFSGELPRVAIFLLISILLACSQVGYAKWNPLSGMEQQKTAISGKVTDSSNEPLAGVTVVVKGTTTGTVTDMNGGYSIEAAPGDVLIFSFVGMKNQEVTVGAEKTINITLEADTQNLDEVVVIGYGTVKKSDLTGAVSVVRSETLEKVSVSTAAESLQGRIAGVSITSKGSAPGSDMDIKIRGVGSFGGNEPLIIIDGVPSSKIDYLNPNDIESVNVLKDAASAAIYGSKAGNGVILIETKKGKKGEPRITFSSSLSSESVSKTLDMANASQFRLINTLVNQNGIDAGTVTDGMPAWLSDDFNEKTADSDWQDALFRTGMRQTYSLAVRGGTENATYSLSGSMFDHKGIVIGSSYKKYNARLSADVTKGKLKISPNISYNENYYDLNNYDPEEHGQGNTFVELRKMSPLVPVYDPDRPNGYGYIAALRGENPIGKENLITNKRRKTELITNLNLEYEVVSGLRVKVQSGLRNYFQWDLDHHPSYQVDQIPVEFPELSEENYRLAISTIEPTISYEKTFGIHSINAVFGTSYYKYKDRNAYAYALGEDPSPDITARAGFLDDENFKTLDAAGGSTFSATGTENIRTEASYFGRINYTLAEKYILQTTLRQDYSSRFGKDLKGGLFPSFALGWNIHKENFFQPIASIVNNLKLRASYGVTGSQSYLDSYTYATLIGSTWLGYPIGTSQSLRPTRYATSLENRNLQWENTESMNYGIDFGLLNSKVTGVINYYVANRSNMLLRKPVPLSAGLIDNPFVNVGKMVNSGWEFELTYRTKLGDVNLSTTGTLTTQKNEVKKLSSKNEITWGSSIDYNDAVTRTKDGDPLASFYLFQMDGIFQSQDEVDAYNANAATSTSLLPNARPGDIRFVDVNGDGILDAKDRLYSGNGIPKYMYSLDFNIEYKGIDLSIFLQGAGGYKIYNTAKYYGENMKGNYNYFANMVNAWTPENHSNTIPRPVFGDPNGNSRSSTRFLEDGDYLRLKNIQLGYSLPQSWLKKVKVEKIRVYISAQNLFTITKYSGYDPEIVERADVWDTGIDYGEYPLTRLYNFGIQFDF